jgi:NADH-quinone oxidoreductase subunit N
MNNTMGDDLILLIPQFILVFAGMALMLLEPFTAAAHKSRLARIAVVAAAAAAFSLRSQWSGESRTILNQMFVVDNFSIFFQWLFLIILAVSAIISMKFNERESINRGEYYSLLLFACSGITPGGFPTPPPPPPFSSFAQIHFITLRSLLS